MIAIPGRIDLIVDQLPLRSCRLLVTAGATETGSESMTVKVIPKHIRQQLPPLVLHTNHPSSRGMRSQMCQKTQSSQTSPRRKHSSIAMLHQGDQRIPILNLVPTNQIPTLLGTDSWPIVQEDSVYRTPTSPTKVLSGLEPTLATGTPEAMTIKVITEVATIVALKASKGTCTIPGTDHLCVSMQ
jgi:hypothetical protein